MNRDAHYQALGSMLDESKPKKQNKNNSLHKSAISVFGENSKTYANCSITNIKPHSHKPAPENPSVIVCPQCKSLSYRYSNCHLCGYDIFDHLIAIKNDKTVELIITKICAGALLVLAGCYLSFEGYEDALAIAPKVIGCVVIVWGIRAAVLSIASNKKISAEEHRRRADDK